MKNDWLATSASWSCMTPLRFGWQKKQPFDAQGVLERSGKARVVGTQF